MAVERSTGGTAVWFGGEFKQVDGVTNRGLVRWDVATNTQFTKFNAEDRLRRQDRPGVRREVLLRPALGRR